MSRYDFTEFPNITITGIDISSLNETELAILYAQARYCQAMTDADIDTMRELVAEDMIYTHIFRNYYATSNLNHWKPFLVDDIICV